MGATKNMDSYSYSGLVGYPGTGSMPSVSGVGASRPLMCNPRKPDRVQERTVLLGAGNRLGFVPFCKPEPGRAPNGMEVGGILSPPQPPAFVLPRLANAAPGDYEKAFAKDR